MQSYFIKKVNARIKYSNKVMSYDVTFLFNIKISIIILIGVCKL